MLLGIVGEGRFHGGGARAERAIHEALEHAGVQHRIVDVVMRAMRFQFVERSLEGKPLADAEVKIAFLLHLFEDEEVFPVAEVLHAGHAVRECVVDREFVALAALFVRRRRNDFVDQVLRGFAKDAGRFAVGVEIDGSALRRLRFAGDARGCERGGVGDGDVAVDAIEKRGMIAGDFVEILARRQNFVRPERVIPVAAGEPVAGGRGFGGGLESCASMSASDLTPVRSTLSLVRPAPPRCVCASLNPGKMKVLVLRGVEIVEDAFSVRRAA